MIVGIFGFSISHMVSADTNSTDQGSLPKMFIQATIPPNSYTDNVYNFAIVPPDGWVIKNQLNKTASALVEFSNENPSSLAHLDIYYNQVKPIPPSVFADSDDTILNAIASKLFDLSKINVKHKSIQRFSDGFIIQIGFSPNPTTQKSPVSEWVIFWLADGRQYFLALTSSQNNFNQNEANFEKSVYTFYVNPEINGSAVPEFGPITTIIFTVMLISTLLLMKIKKLR